MPQEDTKKSRIPAQSICFGLSRELDEQSLTAFLERFASPRLLATLAPRLSDAEINGLIDHLTGLMRSHLAEQEYHRLFLSDR